MYSVTSPGVRCALARKVVGKNDLHCNVMLMLVSSGYRGYLNVCNGILRDAIL